MTEPEQKPTYPKRDFLVAAAPWADTLSKSVAGIAIVLYASGFLVVSLHQSKFGFIGTNPFRPRILAAGAWFFLFVAIPLSIAVRYRTSPWSRFAKDSPVLWIACYGLTVPLGYVLFDISPLWAIAPRVWLWLVLLAALMALMVAARFSKVPEWLVTTASVLLTSFYVVDAARRLLLKHEFELTSVALWFFVCIMLAFLQVSTIDREDLFNDAGWTKPLGMLFLVLLLFAQMVYPHLKASWGGGTPVSVTVYFTKDSLLNPNKSVQAQLIEESDEGFYIVGPKESKAIFVPRSAVAMIYFADKAADSPMLQNVK